MILCAMDKEVAVKYGDKGFGKRPDVLRNPRDVIEFAKNSATSFHCSEELWTNPMLLETGKRKEEVDMLRKGWDLLIDIDCKEIGYSKIAGDLLVQAIGYHDVNCITVKFSGNHGFHIAIPFSAFPEEVNGLKTATLFPEGPRRIAGYLKEMIRPHLAEKILATEPDINTIAKKAGVEEGKLFLNKTFDPFAVLAIDTILLSSRHLYRMPYSFNEKSGLVSIPIDPRQILEFDKADAVAERVEVGKYGFMMQEKAVPGEARRLLLQSFDFKLPEEKEVAGMSRERLQKAIGAKREFEEVQTALAEELFPPCIKTVLAGMGDGKKRAAFILVNFLRSVGWDQEKITERLREWNKKNTPEMLREQDLLAPIRYHGKREKALPPNCDNKQYYIDIGICKPDNLCRYIKNPAQYSKRKARALLENAPKVRSKTKKQKADQELVSKQGQCDEQDKK